MSNNKRRLDTKSNNYVNDSETDEHTYENKLHNIMTGLEEDKIKYELLNNHNCQLVDELSNQIQEMKLENQKLKETKKVDKSTMKLLYEKHECSEINKQLTDKKREQLYQKYKEKLPEIKKHFGKALTLDIFN